VKPALEGVRVIDLGMAWAGATVTRLLADMGAQVIKVESRTRMDGRGGARPPAGFGLFPGGDPGERPWNRSGMFNERHRGKLGVTLELNTPAGNELFKKLAAVSDAVVENFSAGVMQRLALGYHVLREVNPKIVMVSMPGHGSSGPERDYVSYGPTIEQLTGIASITGYRDGPPTNSNVLFADPMSGVLAMGAVLSGILSARRSGVGMHIEVAQRESTARLIGDVFMDYAMNQRVSARMGNRHPDMAPHGCYPCAGEDKWVTIAVSSDEEWRALCSVMARPDLARDERFTDGLSRHRHQDELDQLVASWTRDQDHRVLMGRLQTAGVPAGAVMDAAELWEDRHLRERSFFEEVDHADAGRMTLFSMAWAMSKSQPRLRSAAPTLGEHNNYVLRDILDMSEEDIQRLESEGVIGETPLV